MSDAFGTFLFDYQHEGDTWVFTLVARDEADALARIKSLAAASLKGRGEGSVPAATWGEEEVVVSIRNAARSPAH